MSIISDLQYLPNTAGIVFNANKGAGVTESIIAIILVLAFVASLFLSTNETAFNFLTATLALITGYFFGNRNEKYKDGV